MTDATSASSQPDRPGVRLRSALTQVPAYVPGKPAAPREGVTAYKVSVSYTHLTLPTTERV